MYCNYQKEEERKMSVECTEYNEVTFKDTTPSRCRTRASHSPRSLEWCLNTLPPSRNHHKLMIAAGRCESGLRGAGASASEPNHDMFTLIIPLSVSPPLHTPRQLNPRARTPQLPYHAPTSALSFPPPPPLFPLFFFFFFFFLLRRSWSLVWKKKKKKKKKNWMGDWKLLSRACKCNRPRAADDI